MYDIYIFDLDGTLLDTLGDLASSVNHALAVHGLPAIGQADVRRFVGNGVANLIDRSTALARHSAGTTAAVCAAEVLATFKEHYSSHNQDLTAPYPGVTDMLRRLKARGATTAVVSNKFDAATKNLCHHYFPGLIDVAVGESEGVRRKPAPDTVVRALKELGLSLSSGGTEEYAVVNSVTNISPRGGDALSAVYIGDSDTDILTARNCHLPCISVLWGFRDRAFLTEHGAYSFAATAEDIE